MAQLYKITHIPTGLVYHGSVLKEGKTYLDRFEDHMRGKGGIYIKKLIEDGALKEDFKTELLGVYPLKECLEREAAFAKYTLFPKGLNGNAGLFTSHVGRKRTEITCKRIGDGNRGKTISDEAKLKMSLAKQGIKKGPCSEETKQKISQSNLGKKRSDETRNNISISILNNQNSFFGTEEGKQMAVERNKKLMETGRHPSQIKQTCPYCQKVVSKTNHTRWHGERCKMFLKADKI